MIQRPSQPVPRNISHAAHAVATLLTFGLWAPLWLVASWNTARQNRRDQEAYALALSIYEYNLAMYQNYRPYSGK